MSTSVSSIKPHAPLMAAALILLAALLAGCSGQQALKSDTALPKDKTGAEKVNAEKNFLRYNEAVTLISYNELDKAEEILIEVSEKQPELAGPWANLGLIAMRKGADEQARELLQKSLQQNPQMAQAHHLLGLIDYQQGNILQAKSHYENAIKHKPDYALAHHNLALIYDIYLHEVASAYKHYKRYLELVNYNDKETADWLEQLSYSLNQ